jgi:hypothetical protein
MKLNPSLPMAMNVLNPSRAMLEAKKNKIN